MEVTKDNWRIGDKVKQKIDSNYYYQTREKIGTILGEGTSEGWIDIDFGNYRNCYQCKSKEILGHLIFVKENININLNLI